MIRLSSQFTIHNSQFTIWTSVPSRFHDECLSRYDSGAGGRQTHGEGLQVSALQTPVPPGRKLGAGLDRDDPGREARVGPGLWPDGHAASGGKGRKTFLGDLDAQVRRFDLERDDGISRGDEFSLPVVSREHGAAGGRNESALLLEVVDFLQARGERTRPRV